MREPEADDGTMPEASNPIRLIDCTFEVRPGLQTVVIGGATMTEEEWKRGAETGAWPARPPVIRRNGSPTAEIRVRVAVEGEGQRWTPHVRAAFVGNVEKSEEVPTEFALGGAEALASVGPTPEVAADGIARKFVLTWQSNRADLK
jgi:hypothetical protein